MMNTRKFLPRRTFLRGVGGALALPLLDAMVPAGTLLAQTAARPVRRFGVVYLSNGIVMRNWTPAAEAKFRIHASAKTAGAVPRQHAGGFGPGHVPRGGAHAGRSTGFLTGVTAGDGLTLSRSGEYDISASVSADQIMARGGRQRDAAGVARNGHGKPGYLRLL